MNESKPATGFLGRVLEVAQSVGEPACVRDLMLPGPGNVLNKICQEIYRMSPSLPRSARVSILDLAGCFLVVQMLEGQRGTEDILQDSADVSLVVGKSE